MCENLALSHICKSCQELFLSPSIYKRQLSNGIQVISFYKYSEIKDLLHTKHTDLGYHIYNILAKLSFKKFASEFPIKEDIVSIAIDDNVKSGYSHTAILNAALKSSNIRPLYSKLRAKNNISYSGKDRAFRASNPRNFELQNFKQKNLILVDDVVTTGSTLSEAISLLQRENKNIYLALTLCDVANK